MVQLALFVGKVVFLVVLYLFLFYVVRSINRDLRVAAELSSEIRSTSVSDWSLASAYGVPSAVLDHRSWVLILERVPRHAKGERVVLPPHGSLLVGRAPDCDLELADTFVSAHHARFSVTPEGLVVHDLGSTNGTYVNGERIEGAVLLAPGDRVLIGDCELRVAGE